MSNKIDEILNGLYIGNYEAALDKEIIKELNITTVINCTKKDKKLSDINYLQIPINNPPNPDDIRYLNQNFLYICKYIDDKLYNNNKILIHCVNGSQRSAAVTAIFLMYKFGLNFVDACKFIKIKRPICFFGRVNYSESLLFINQFLDNNKKID
jgi:protein-tyrosine phosphatase